MVEPYKVLLKCILFQNIQVEHSSNCCVNPDQGHHIYVLGQCSRLQRFVHAASM